MAIKGQSITITYRAWDSSANAFKTGDGANHTLRLVKDGGAAAAPANSPSEVDSTNMPGVYKLALTATEMTASVVSLGGKSSTANVSLFFGGDIVTEQGILPAGTTPGGNGGLPTADASNGVKISVGTGTGQLSITTGAVVVGTNNDKTGYTLGQSFPANFASMAISGAGAVTVGSNNDKTGYSLTQSFPANFASLAISVAGAVTVGTNSDKTGYSLATAPPTAAAIRAEMDSNSTKFATILANQATIAGYIDTEVAAIKLVTDQLATMLELDGAGPNYQFTAASLDQAPAGGGGGGDATAANQDTILAALTAIQGTSFDTATDSLHVLRARGDSAWITATGFSTLDAAGVRSALGMATSNLVTEIWTTALTEAYRAHAAEGTAAQFLYEIISHLINSDISGTTKNLRKLDGTTIAKTGTLDDATNPSQIREAS